MKLILTLAARSLWNRRSTALLTILTIAVSTALLLGVERLRTQVRASFTNTISGTDLIVGARSGSIQLLLYSVFRIGNATSNIHYDTYKYIATAREVAWAVPISLGDSHRGFRVMGTTQAYFKHYRYARKRKLRFRQGHMFKDLFDVVLGAEVADRLGYKIGDRIVIAHGLGRVGLTLHKDTPFRVSGILARTGTPVDKTLHVSLRAIEAIHVDWRYGMHLPGRVTPADKLRQMKLTPRQVTAVLVGVKSRLMIFRLQRRLNTTRREPLLAILPGVALQELWDLMGTAETGLYVISWFVVLAAVTGMLAVFLAALNERRREMAILRANGASPWHITGLVLLEAFGVAVLATALGAVLLLLVLAVAGPAIEARYGIFLPLHFLSGGEWAGIGLIILAAGVMGLIPAWRAYSMTMADGLTIRH